MKATRVLLLVLVGLAALASACTGDDGDGADGATAGTAGTGGTGVTGEIGPTPVTSGSETVGTYEYANAGLVAVLELEGGTGTLEVDNGTDHELGGPGFYARHALSGARTDGEVISPAPIPSGETASFDVRIDGVTVGDIGVIGLLFGEEDYGLLVRTA